MIHLKYDDRIFDVCGDVDASMFRANPEFRIAFWLLLNWLNK